MKVFLALAFVAVATAAPKQAPQYQAIDISPVFVPEEVAAVFRKDLELNPPTNFDEFAPSPVNFVDSSDDDITPIVLNDASVPEVYEEIPTIIVNLVHFNVDDIPVSHVNLVDRLLDEDIAPIVLGRAPMPEVFEESQVLPVNFVDSAVDDIPASPVNFVDNSLDENIEPVVLKEAPEPEIFENMDSAVEDMPAFPVNFVDSADEEIQASPVNFVDAAEEDIPASPINFVDAAEEEIPASPINFVGAPENIDLEKVAALDDIPFSSFDNVNDARGFDVEPVKVAEPGVPYPVNFVPPMPR